VDWKSLPLLAGALDFARDGILTGASARNWTGYGSFVTLGAGLGDAERALLTDPQTSGGLLVACDPSATAQVLSTFREEGFGDARVIGDIRAGAAHVTVD
jgi:selenide,water dikinase